MIDARTPKPINPKALALMNPVSALMAMKPGAKVIRGTEWGKLPKIPKTEPEPKREE